MIFRESLQLAAIFALLLAAWVMTGCNRGPELPPELIEPTSMMDCWIQEQPVDCNEFARRIGVWL